MKRKPRRLVAGPLCESWERCLNEPVTADWETCTHDSCWVIAAGVVLV